MVHPHVQVAGADQIVQSLKKLLLQVTAHFFFAFGLVFLPDFFFGFLLRFNASA